MTHTTTSTAVLLDCGHERPVLAVGHVGVTGVALDATGATFCFPCGDVAQLAEMANGDNVFAYVALDDRTVTTWSGGRLMVITAARDSRTGWHGSTISSYRATAADGSRWYGRNGGAGMCIRMRRSTATPRA